MVICVEEAYSRALQKSRNELLKEKNKYSIIFSTTLHPNIYRLGWIIQKHSHIRSSGPAESKHSKQCLYMQMLNQCPEFVKTSCEWVMQRMCSMLQYRDCVIHPHTGKKYLINDDITCCTYVIYMINCPCGLSHNCKTSQSLKRRISEVQ